MALIIRIDVDRPYGRQPLWRHVLSRVGSDCWFPRVEGFGYLSELRTMLRMLNQHRARAYAFFRRCTLPSASILELMEVGGHEIGLHLEDSRSFDSFRLELESLKHHVNKKISALSKHGSGGRKYGRRHYHPYEPRKYVDWAGRAGMSVLFGNLEDPSLRPLDESNTVHFYPSAFWLEPHWRNTDRYTREWLLNEAAERDVVLLVHPENVLACPLLTRDFEYLIDRLPSRIL